MPKKLKDLKVTKVDFVDAGANQEANIMLFKSKDGTQNAETAKSGDPITEGEPKTESAFKRVLAKIAKALGIEDGDDLEAFNEVADTLTKGQEAESFNDRMAAAARRRITSEIWDICYALEESLCSVIQDDEIPWESKADAMKESLAQFSTAANDLIPVWASGKTAEKITKAALPMTPERIANAKNARASLDAIIAKAEGDNNPAKPPEGGEKPDLKKTKGELEDMKIDKSKLTPEELATLEAIEKKAGIQEEQPTNPAPAGDPVAKGAEGNPTPATAPAGDGNTDDIYKGLHPAIKAELESLRKTADAIEERELHEIAKKYEVIGKKADELAPTLKVLKAAGGDAYAQMIALLDASVEAFEKSGIFTEIGKKGSGTADAWTAIEKHADEIQKSAPTLSRQQAIDKACDQHPELVTEYEKNR